MHNKRRHIFTTLLGGAAATALVFTALRDVVATPPHGAAAGTMLALVVAAAACAVLRRPARGLEQPALAWSFVMTALVLAPRPGALLAALAASVAGAGRGRRLGTFAAEGVAVSVGALLLDPFRPDAAWSAPTALLWFLALYGSLRLTSWAVASLLGPGYADHSGPLWWRRSAAESACALLAWILCGLARQGDGAAAAAAGLLVLAAQWLLVRSAVARRRALAAQAALDSRLVELDTLHAISREVIASLDVGRICMIVERGCRKIFNVDFLAIALVEPGDPERAALYTHGRGQGPQRRPVEADDALLRWVAEHKRGLVVEDLKRPCRDKILPSALIDSATRSLLVAPLIVEERALGLLSVQRRSAGVFDEHGLHVLRTMAQQAAVAIENARHYERATVDSLTGFFLRDYFFRRLEEEYNRAARYGGAFSVLMVDLDGFKAINDRHGHLSGDRYLRAVGETIQDQLRAADLPCRYGGDEFCLLLPETDPAGARVIAERIRAAVSRKVVAAGRAALRATASIGLASFPEHDGGSVRALMQNADEALYRAKRAGRDCVMPYAA